MKPSRILIAFAVLSACSGGSGSTLKGDVFVDSVMGDDANDGQSVATAWRTLARVNRAFYAPEPRIQFKRGQEFRGSLT